MKEQHQIRHLPAGPWTGSFTAGLLSNCLAQWLTQEKCFLLLTAGDQYLAKGVPKMSNGRAAHKNRDALEKEYVQSVSAGGT